MSRAKNYLEDLEKSNQKLVDEKIKDEDLKNINGMTIPMLALLAKENILTLNDFAELAAFELIDKEERPGRNPKTGEEVTISARRVVTFRSGRKLRKRVAFDDWAKQKILHN